MPRGNRCRIYLNAEAMGALRSLKQPGDTYDAVLRRLLNLPPRKQT